MSRYPKRIYAKEAEKMFGVQILGREGLSGRGLDGITVSQKKALQERGMNTTGFRYKGEACRATNILNEREKEHLPSLWDIIDGADPIPKEKRFYRVKKITPNGNTMSPEIFTTKNDAEDHAQKMIPEKYDFEIVTFVTAQYYIVETRSHRYFSTMKNAQIIAESLQANWRHG